MFTPEKIEKLESNEIFVFGSNLAGRHGGGAAKLAYDKFGAQWGIGEGITGQCYAFPTLDENYNKVHLVNIISSFVKLYQVANNKPNLTFYLTKIGLGIAGFKVEDILACIRVVNDSLTCPNNIMFPKEFCYG